MLDLLIQFAGFIFIPINMSLLRGISALFGLLLCVAFGIAFLPNVADLANTARTDPTTQTGLVCTADSSGNCLITLSSPHMHADTSGMTVTETAPSSGDKTSTSTVGNPDRAEVTVSGLTSGVTYTFTVAYEKVDANAANATGLPDFLNLAPILFVMMLLVVGVVIGGATMSRTFNR